MEQLTIEKCRALVRAYGIENITQMEMIDSSHGEGDIRHNYILDRRYVLRVNSAEVFTEARLAALNCLIGRYREFGVAAPLFLSDREGCYLHRLKDGWCYLSEYLDGKIPPEDMTQKQAQTLTRERLTLIARFAERYRGVDLSPVMSMYALFELSPYDAPTGIDEKQDNLNSLLCTLRACGCAETARRLEEENQRLRKRLLRQYRALPRCVFHGDENRSNLIVDGAFHILGLFDFNMAGTDVIANYLANNALLEPSAWNEDAAAELPAETLYEKMLAVLYENTALLRKYYRFSAAEWAAYFDYAKLALLSSYPNVCAYRQLLEQPETRDKTATLLERLICFEGGQERLQGGQTEL